MKIEHQNKTVRRVLNEQFKIIGVKATFDTIEEEIEVGKKKIKWQDYYKFENKEQYEKWKVWMREELDKEGIGREADELDMLWGLHYKWKEEGKSSPLLLF